MFRIYIDTHIAQETGARITGINIDPKQLKEATDRALFHNLTNQLTYLKASFNDPLPFPDEHFDGLYNIQALSYTINFDALFKEMYRVLKSTGSIFLHCDWHADAYIRVEILDKLFGEKNFRNHIIWKRTNTPKGSQFSNKQFGVVTDSIFWYSKTATRSFSQPM